MPGVKGRAIRPTDCTKREEPQNFRVWVERNPDCDFGPQWECVALFGFLRDCLDYIAGLQDSGVDCVFQSPADCRTVLASERRVVWRAEVVV